MEKQRERMAAIHPVGSIESVIEHLEAGDSLDIFLEDFPSVSRELANKNPRRKRRGIETPTT